MSLYIISLPSGHVERSTASECAACRFLTVRLVVSYYFGVECKHWAGRLGKIFPSQQLTDIVC